MLNRLTIRQRILVIFIAITFVGGTVQFLIAGRQLEAATLEFYQHHLETDALLVQREYPPEVEQVLRQVASRNS